MSDGNPPKARRRSVGCIFALWLLAGLFLGVVVTLIVFRWQYADPFPEITPADFQAARQRWEQQGPQNYNIEVQVTGTRAATYRVQVRDGAATAAWINATPLPQQRTWGTWSVRGMFGTIARDIDALERRAAGQADKSTPRLTLRAEFDERTGYPIRYRRIQWGSPVEVTWEVTQFEVLPAKTNATQTQPE